MRILVCGGRDFNDYAKVSLALEELVPVDFEERYLTCVIIHGGATGADSLADRWAVNNYVPIKEYKADWKTHGRAAGPIRNQRMIDEGKPDIVVAFKGGTGTADCVAKARAAGVHVIEIA